MVDASLIKRMLKEFEPDVATRFVLSAVSLNSEKIRKAFEIACYETEIRAASKKKPSQEKVLAVPQTKKKGKVSRLKPVITYLPSKDAHQNEEDEKTAQEVLNVLADLFQVDESEITVLSEDDDIPDPDGSDDK